MKESERLTVYIAGYAHGYGFIGGTPPRRTKNVCRGRFDATFCVDRLAAYEDTGLLPEEVEKLKAENAELRARLEKWREPFVEQDQTTGNWWVFHSRIEVFASANSDLFETREEAEARLKELGGKENAKE